MLKRPAGTRSDCRGGEGRGGLFFRRLFYHASPDGEHAVTGNVPVGIFPQGIAVGGEVPGAWVFVAEHAPAGHRGYALGFLQAGLTFGYLLGALTATALAQLFTPQEILDYAWRYPFLLGGVFGVIGVWLRRWLSETPVFVALQHQRDAAAELPLRTVLRDLETFPHAYALPSQWPTNAWQRDAADRNVAQLLGDYRDRLLHPVHSLSASKLLLQKHIPDSLPSNLGNACRALARQVMEIMEVASPNAEAEAPATRSAIQTPDAYAGSTHH